MLASQTRLRPQQTPSQGREDPHRRKKLRLRQLARTRRLGPYRLRLPRRHRPQLRRHLLLQRRKKRHGPRPPLRSRRGNSDARSEKNPAHKITINLEAQTITDDEGFSAHFDIDPFRKYCLLNGLDDIGLTLRHEAELDKYETKHDTEFWLKPRAVSTN